MSYREVARERTQFLMTHLQISAISNVSHAAICHCQATDMQVSISELIRNVYVVERTMHDGDLSGVLLARFSYWCSLHNTLRWSFNVHSILAAPF